MANLSGNAPVNRPRANPPFLLGERRWRQAG